MADEIFGKNYSRWEATARVFQNSPRLYAMGLTGTDLLVLQAVAGHSSSYTTGEGDTKKVHLTWTSYRGQEALADEAGCKARQVRKTLQKLEKLGLICFKGVNPKYRTDIYRVEIDVIEGRAVAGTAGLSAALEMKRTGTQDTTTGTLNIETGIQDTKTGTQDHLVSNHVVKNHLGSNHLGKNQSVRNRLAPVFQDEETDKTDPADHGSGIPEEPKSQNPEQTTTRTDPAKPTCGQPQAKWLPFNPFELDDELGYELSSRPTPEYLNPVQPCGGQAASGLHNQQRSQASNPAQPPAAQAPWRKPVVPFEFDEDDALGTPSCPPSPVSVIIPSAVAPRGSNLPNPRKNIIEGGALRGGQIEAVANARKETYASVGRIAEALATATGKQVDPSWFRKLAPEAPREAQLVAALAWAPTDPIWAKILAGWRYPPACLVANDYDAAKKLIEAYQAIPKPEPELDTEPEPDADEGALILGASEAPSCADVGMEYGGNIVDDDSLSRAPWGVEDVDPFEEVDDPEGDEDVDPWEEVDDPEGDEDVDPWEDCDCTND